MTKLSIPIQLKEGKVIVRDDYKVIFQEFKFNASENESEALLEITLAGSKRDDLVFYYKTTVLPSIRDILQKSDSKNKFDLEEVDSILKNRFWTKKSEDIHNSFFYAKPFQSLDKSTQLNILSDINLWILHKYRTQLPKIRQ